MSTHSVAACSSSLLELTSHVKESTGVELPTSQLSMTTTVEELVAMVLKRLQQEASVASATAVQGGGEAEGGVGPGPAVYASGQKKRTWRYPCPMSPRLSAFDNEEEGDDQHMMDGQSQEEQVAQLKDDMSADEMRKAQATQSGAADSPKGCLRECSYLHHDQCTTLNPVILRSRLSLTPLLARLVSCARSLSDAASREPGAPYRRAAHAGDDPEPPLRLGTHRLRQ